MTEAKQTNKAEVFSAIATAIDSTRLFMNSKKLHSFEPDDKDKKQHWVESQLTSAIKFKFRDNKLMVLYTTETVNPLKIDNHYENKIDKIFSDILKEIKSKYKEITGKTLSLKEHGDLFEQVIEASFRRQMRTYIQTYTIGGIDSYEEEYNKEVKDLLKGAIEYAEKVTAFKKRKK